LGVCLGGIAGVLHGMEVVSVRDMGVMRGLFVIAGIVMFRRLLVMPCRVFVVLRRFPVMVCRFFGHQGLLRVNAFVSRVGPARPTPTT